MLWPLPSTLPLLESLWVECRLQFWPMCCRDSSPGLPGVRWPLGP